MSAATGPFSRILAAAGHTKDRPLYPDLTARIIPGAFPHSAYTTVSIEMMKANVPREEVTAFREEAKALINRGQTTALYDMLHRVMRIDATVGQSMPPPGTTLYVPKTSGQVVSFQRKGSQRRQARR